MNNFFRVALIAIITISPEGYSKVGEHSKSHDFCMECLIDCDLEFKNQGCILAGVEKCDDFDDIALPFNESQDTEQDEAYWKTQLCTFLKEVGGIKVGGGCNCDQESSSRHWVGFEYSDFRSDFRKKYLWMIDNFEWMHRQIQNLTCTFLLRQLDDINEILNGLGNHFGFDESKCRIVWQVVLGILCEITFADSIKWNKINSDVAEEVSSLTLGRSSVQRQEQGEDSDSRFSY